MRTYAQIERDALCDTALQLGPDAPTLCEGWTVRDLMAHLAMRERRPEAIGVVVEKFAPAAERTRRRYALRPFEDLVDMVREGPHELSVFRIPALDARANLSEYFIHYEDLLRAQLPDVESADVRELDRAEQDDLLGVLAQMSRLILGGSRLRIAAQCPGHTPISLSNPEHPEGSIVILGEPSEVLLHISGRPALVRFEGDPEAINRFATEHKGL